MAKAVLSLGSNLGNRRQHIITIKERLSDICELLTASPLYETEPVGVSDGHGNYLNQVLLIETTLKADMLLKELQRIELSLGRSGKGELLPRKADIDILVYEGLERCSDFLTLPHHALWDRYFSVLGLLAVAPNWEFNDGSTAECRSIDPEVLQQGVTVVA